MNAKEFYLHLRNDDLRAPATPAELARPARAGFGPVSTSPFENIMGKLITATTIIGQLMAALAQAQQIIKGRANEVGTRHPLEADFDRRLVDLGITADDLAAAENQELPVPEVELAPARPRTSAPAQELETQVGSTRPPR